MVLVHDVTRALPLEVHFLRDWVRVSTLCSVGRRRLSRRRSKTKFGDGHTGPTPLVMTSVHTPTLYAGSELCPNPTDVSRLGVKGRDISSVHRGVGGEAAVVTVRSRFTGHTVVSAVGTVPSSLPPCRGTPQYAPTRPLVLRGDEGNKGRVYGVKKKKEEKNLYPGTR